ncbi:MAG: hypothetical protein FJ276_16280 [Planctomycetes bacterium]|nr:hypothetical protein [Planctomycetota bacterium]
MPVVRFARLARFPLLMAACTLAHGAAPGTEWADERQAGRFVLHADFPLDEHPRLAGELASLERDVTSALGVEPTRELIHLFLFRDSRSYQTYLNEYFPGAPVRRALFIKGKQLGWVFAFESPEFEVDVRHESTHALLHSCLPTVPLWLDEGLAEYFEVPVDQRVYDNPHCSPTRWAARFGRVRPLRDLEQLRDVRELGEAEYRASWAWVHFMLHGPPEAHTVLVQYLRDIQSNMPPGTLEDRLRRAVPDVEARFLAHFRNWRPR